MASYRELDQTFVNVIRRRQDALIVDDLSQAQGTAAAAQDLRSAAIFPVRVQNATVAVLWFGAYEVELFDEAKRNFISTLASQAAFLVQNARLFQSAEGERRRLAAILSSTSDAILVIDAKAQLALTNPAAQHLLGLHEEDHGKVLTLLTIPDELVGAFARSDEELHPLTVEVPFEEHSPGDLPNFIKEHGGEVVLAYGMGRRAIDYFNSLGIEVVTGAYGKIKDVVEAFINQVLEVDPYWKEKIEREKEKEG